MQSRRDHVQAYQFFTGRLSSALVSGEPGGGDLPLRRSGLGTAFGILVAVLLCGGFAVYGLINPGGATSWKQAGSIIVEKETGNRYVYVDNTLYPTRNTASALLYFADGSGHMVSVSRNSLAGVPHGPAVGIPGAPDSVPQGAALLPSAWSVCAQPGSDGSTIDFGVGSAHPMALEDQVVVTGPDGAEYDVWRDVAHRVGSPCALLALGLADVPPVHVSTLWLAALRTGPALAAPTIENAGHPGSTVDGQPTLIGQLLATSVGGRTQDYVLRKDGVAPVSRTAFALLAAQPGEVPVRTVPAGALSAVPASPDTATLNALPDLVSAPTFRPGTAAVCVRQGGAQPAGAAGTLVTEQLSVPGNGTSVAVPAGRGVFAEATPVDPAGVPALFLITDQGTRFPLTEQAAAALQLGGNPVGVPATVLAAMPGGPPLLTGESIMAAGRAGGQ